MPVYHDFKFYQFLDILDALSFRLMVQDHINKILEEEELLIMQIGGGSGSMSRSRTHKDGGAAANPLTKVEKDIR